MLELDKTFNAYHCIIKRWLEALGFTRKFDHWVLHKFTADQQDQQTVTYVSQCKNKLFLT